MVSKDEVCYPKDVSNGIVKLTCSTSDNFLPTPVDDPIDNKTLAKAVDESLATSGLEMGEFQHLKPLDLDSPAQERTLEARLGGHHIAKVKFTLENAHGGSKVLSAKGKRRIAKWTKTKYRHPGTRFRSMKTKRKAKIDRVLAQQKTSSSTLIIKPGDFLSMDMYMSGIPNTPYFHVITDSVVDFAWVHGLQSKAEGDVNLEEHIRNFYKPFTTCGDAAGEHLGGENGRPDAQGVYTVSSIDTGEAIHAWWRTIHFAIDECHHLPSTGLTSPNSTHPSSCPARMPHLSINGV